MRRREERNKGGSRGFPDGMQEEVYPIKLRRTQSGDKYLCELLDEDKLTISLSPFLA